MKRKLSQGQEMYLDICSFPMALPLERLGLLRRAGTLRVNAMAGREARLTRIA